jgi:hypothetical protein
MVRILRLSTPATVALAMLLAVVIASSVILLARRGPAPAPSGTAGSLSGTTADFLTVDGRAFSYRGQQVVLHGVNFNNEPGLPSGGGSGRIDGINIGEADYSMVHSWGGNTIRWGMSYAWYVSDRARFFQTLDQHIAWAKQYHLWVIPVLFGDTANGTDNNQPALWSDSGNKIKLVDFWVEVSRRYANEPTIAGYDILNEPNPGSLSEWQSLALRLRDAIAAADPYHFVAVEATTGGDLPRLGRDRVVYSVHNYKGGDNLPQVSDAPLWVGEFGSRDDPSWTAREINRYAAAGVHWTYFVMRENPSGYGLYTGFNNPGDFSKPNQDMIDAVQAGMVGSVIPSG